MPAVPAFRFCPSCAAPLEPIAAGRDAGRPACPSGHFVHYDNPAVTVFGFVRDGEGRYLVLLRADEPFAGRWDLPGGFVESGETPAQALRRELREETGLQVRLERLLGAFASRYGDGGRWTVDVGYEARLTGGAMRLDAEKAAAEWRFLEELPPLAFAGERAAARALVRRPPRSRSR